MLEAIFNVLNIVGVFAGLFVITKTMLAALDYDFEFTPRHYYNDQYDGWIPTKVTENKQMEG